MEGLQYLATIPERVAREEFQILYDEPVYDCVRRFASVADMQEIDGWARSFYTLEGHIESILHYRKPLLPEPDSSEWRSAKHEVKSEILTMPKVRSLSFTTQFDDVKFESSSAAGYGYTGKMGEGENLKELNV